MITNKELNFIWTICCLSVVIILILALWLYQIEHLAELLNFALALTSFVVAAIAIIYGFISNSSLERVLGEIKSAATSIDLVAKNIPLEIGALRREQINLSEQILLSQKNNNLPPPADPAAPAAPTPAPTQTPTPANPAPAARTPDLTAAQKDAIILPFVIDVTRTFLDSSSWNGLKVMYICRHFLQKQQPFDLRAVCSIDNSMSFDYAFGYLVCATSARFLVYQTNEPNTIFWITSMPVFVANDIDRAIQGRLNYVQGEQRLELLKQFEQLKLYLDKTSKPVVLTPATPAPAVPAVAPINTDTPNI